MKRGPTGTVIAGSSMGGEIVRAFMPAALTQRAHNNSSRETLGRGVAEVATPSRRCSSAAICSVAGPSLPAA